MCLCHAVSHNRKCDTQSDNVTGLCHRFGMCHGVCASDVMASVHQMSCHIMLKLLLQSWQKRHCTHTSPGKVPLFWEAVGAVFSIVRSLFFGVGSFFCILLFCSSSRTALTGESVRIAVDLQHSK